MGLSKKMEWFRWIRKYSTGILDTKTGSMETLIDSASSKSVNYAYTSSISADDEFVNAAAPPHQQRPMLPPPTTPQDHQYAPPQLPPSSSNDVYDCCVSLDGIPIKHEFQYTLSDTDGCGKITKHDIEGLASKILESMYGTTLKFSPQGQRTVKVTLNVRQSSSADGRDRKTKSSSADKQLYGSRKTTSAAEFDEHFTYAAPIVQPGGCPIYGAVKGSSPHHHRVKPGAQRYRRDQLVEMVQKSLAENLSFQNQRKTNKPEGYHRPRTKRRQSSASTIQGIPLPSPPVSATKPKTPAKVAWSPYDFEPVAHVPSAHAPHHHHHQQQHHQHERLRNIIRGHQQPLYGNGDRGRAPHPSTVDDVVKMLNARQQHRTTTTNNTTAAIVGDNQQSKDVDTTPANVEQTKNIIDHLRYKRAKLASKKIHHHIHEHHHYHHYDYYIV